MSRENTSILVVDDDVRLQKLLGQYLMREGYHVATAHNAATARKMLEDDLYDLAVVDVMMPGESGLDLVRGLQENPPWPFPIPVLMLTAQNEAENRIAGLESGADDYLGKPFEPRELVLRIEKLLQRASGWAAQQTVKPTAPKHNVVKFGEYIFNITLGDLRRDGEFISLTSGELNLLTILARNLDATVMREELSRQLNGISERSVDVQVTRLRKRIEENPKKPRYIQSLWGKGYVLKSR